MDLQLRRCENGLDTLSFVEGLHMLGLVLNYRSRFPRKNNDECRFCRKKVIFAILIF